MNLARLSIYESEILELDWYHKTGHKKPSFSFGMSTSVSRAVIRKSELWTHSLIQEHLLGQKAVCNTSKRSIASFGLREGTKLGTQIELHGWKGYVMQELWLYVIIPFALKSGSWSVSSFSDCPLLPVDFYVRHPLQGGSLYFHVKPLDDIY